MLNYKVKIGLVPMRRNTTDRPRGASWNWYSPEQREKQIVSYIEENFASDNVEFVDTKGLGIGNLIFDDASAKQAIARMKEQNVDAIMIINCNFGNEEAAGDIAYAIGKPVLLWAPLDVEYSEDGTRTTDSQCGLFGVSRQLQRLHIPFSNIPSCRVEDEEFKEGLERFIRVSCMVKNFQGMRIGQVGTRPAPFYSVISNEGELLEKFGIRIVTINFAVVEQKMKTIAEDKKEETGMTGVVTGSDLRIRNGAGTNHGIVGVLQKGHKVTILETKVVNGMKWGRISIGWICMDYVKLD